ncbi:MAG: hypothetical protein ACOYYS_04155 [Chloroflexota bacterium]
MNTQTYKERLLENENLTADLEDPEADWLLQWGVSQIPIVTDGVTDEAFAGEKISALATFIRRTGRTVVRRNRRTPEELADALRELGNFYARAFGACRLLSPDDYLRAAIRLQALSTLEGLQTIVQWFTPAPDQTSETSHAPQT